MLLWGKGAEGQGETAMCRNTARKVLPLDTSSDIVVGLEMAHELLHSHEPSAGRPTTSQLAIRSFRALVLLQMSMNRGSAAEFLATASPVTTCRWVHALLVAEERVLRQRDHRAPVTGKAGARRGL